MAKKIIIQDLMSKETRECSIDEILEIINRDRSEKWTDYNKKDWKEGWYERCEGDIYKIVSIQ